MNRFHRLVLSIVPPDLIEAEAKRIRRRRTRLLQSRVSAGHRGTK